MAIISTHPSWRTCPSVFAALVLIAVGCGREVPTAPVASPSPSPTPVSPPTPQYTAAPVPFNLTESRTFDIWDWDGWLRSPTQTAIQFRWNAATSKYEVMAPGYDGWNRLEALSSSNGTPYNYDVFGSDGTKLPLHMPVFAPPHFNPRAGYVGRAHILEGYTSVTQFAFGLATAPGDVPVSGTMTCEFSEDEIGSGGLTFDLTAGKVSGWAEPFWAPDRYELVQTSFATGATTFATTFGAGGLLEGRFFGPQAANVTIRSKGGGQGFSAINGILTGTCK